MPKTRGTAVTAHLLQPKLTPPISTNNKASAQQKLRNLDELIENTEMEPSMDIIHVPYYTKYFVQQMYTPHPSHEREPMICSMYIRMQHT